LSEQEIRFFDERAKNYSLSDIQATHLGKIGAFGPRPSLWIAFLLNLVEEDILLDVGCGSGQFLQDMQGIFFPSMVIGCDASFHMVKRARKNIPEFHYVVADALHLPFKQESFTKIVCLSVLQYIPPKKLLKRYLFHNDDIFKEAMGEMYRILCQKGQIIVSSQNPDYPVNILVFLYQLARKTFGRRTLVNYGISPKAIQKTCKRLGFTIETMCGSREWYYADIVKINSV
jgi:ubiquinone/menaquinone biosynthesis C-methylase UbiE